MTSLNLAKLNSLHLNIEFTAMLVVNLTIHNKCSFHTVIFKSLRATNNSDSLPSWAQNKSLKLARHVAYCVLVLPSKAIGTKAIAFNR